MRVRYTSDRHVHESLLRWIVLKLESVVKSTPKKNLQARRQLPTYPRKLEPCYLSMPSARYCVRHRVRQMPHFADWALFSRSFALLYPSISSVCWWRHRWRSLTCPCYFWSARRNIRVILACFVAAASARVFAIGCFSPVKWSFLVTLSTVWRKWLTESRLIIGVGGGSFRSLFVVVKCQRFLELFLSHKNSVLTLIFMPQNRFIFLRVYFCNFLLCI